MGSVQQLGELGVIRRLRAVRRTARVRASGPGSATTPRCWTWPGTPSCSRPPISSSRTSTSAAPPPPSTTSAGRPWPSTSPTSPAMGGRPRWALVALALPASARTSRTWTPSTRACAEAAAPHGVAIVGGDTSASPGGWMVNVTLLGEHTGDAAAPLDGAPGDAVAVTGSLGRSAAGLARTRGRGGRRRARRDRPGGARRRSRAAHLRPPARVAEGRWLGQPPGVHAHDGLLRRSRHGPRPHLPREPGGRDASTLDRVAACLPPSREARPRLRRRSRAIGRPAGGEDYELLLTCEPAAASTRLAAGLAQRHRHRAHGDRRDRRRAQPRSTFVGRRRASRSRCARGYEHFRG